MAALGSQAVPARDGRAGRILDFQTENAALATWVKTAGDEAQRIQARLQKIENQLDRFRAEEFWDRVMQEIAEFLVERGPLTASGILPELRAVTHRGATLHKEPLTPGTLKKMDVRVFYGRYFEPRDDGRYARKAGCTLATPFS